MTIVRAIVTCGGKAGRLAAVASLAATLAGCYTAPSTRMGAMVTRFSIPSAGEPNALRRPD